MLVFEKNEKMIWNFIINPLEENKENPNMLRRNKLNLTKVLPSYKRASLEQNTTNLF